ncbi:hypothetical protein U2H31_006519 [Pseudomonas aeruginosa]|nr:hypothetical protein [Pseudomonas aeruginosa]
MKKSLSSLCAVLFASMALVAGPASATDQLPPSVNPHLNSKYLLQYRALLVKFKKPVAEEQLRVKSGTPLDEVPAAIAGADGYTILRNKRLHTTDGEPATHKDLVTHTRTVPEEIPGGLRGRQISETIGEVMNIAPAAATTAKKISSDINFFHYIKAEKGGVATYKVGGQKTLGAGDYATYTWQHDGQQYALLLQLEAVDPIKHD